MITRGEVRLVVPAGIIFHGKPPRRRGITAKSKRCGVEESAVQGIAHEQEERARPSRGPSVSRVCAASMPPRRPGTRASIWVLEEVDGIVACASRSTEVPRRGSSLRTQRLGTPVDDPATARPRRGIDRGVGPAITRELRGA